MRLLPLFILGITTLTLACAPAKFRKVVSGHADVNGGGGAVEGTGSADAKPDGSDDANNLPDLPSVPPCFAPSSYGDDGDYPSQNTDPAQNPGQSAGQNGDPTQNPGQNPNQNPEQDPEPSTTDGDAGTPPVTGGEGGTGTLPGNTGDGTAGEPPC